MVNLIEDIDTIPIFLDKEHGPGIYIPIIIGKLQMTILETNG